MNNFGPVILFCTIIIGFVVFYERKKSARIHNESDEEFWKREAHANNVRKKDLAFLNYIIIPIDSLPLSGSTDEEVKGYQQTIQILASKRILNLSGVSNTDLKLEYGAANLTLLTEYDNNYIILVNTIAKLGARLLEIGQSTDAITILKYGISIGSDVSRNYYLLADEYRKMNRPDDIDQLIETAGRLDSIMKPAIIKKLNEIRGFCD